MRADKGGMRARRRETASSSTAVAVAAGRASRRSSEIQSKSWSLPSFPSVWQLCCLAVPPSRPVVVRRRDGRASA